jgi:signal transduction histidine kinase
MDGTWYWHTSSVVPLKAEHGTIAGIYGIAHDITGCKRVEEALRQANRQLNLLSSITRHDIKNQLAALKGYLALSQKMVGKPEDLLLVLVKEQHVVGTIEEQITFTGDYQDLGAAAPAWQSVNGSIRKTVAGLSLRDVRLVIDQPDVEIFADPLIGKVFYNLIENALRYGGDGMTTIRISSHETGTGRMIVCEDDGTGIPADDKSHLFTRGFGKHTGLGLFLCREILLITGCTITENGMPGKGARFELSVPAGTWRFATGPI